MAPEARFEQKPVGHRGRPLDQVVGKREEVSRVQRFVRRGRQGVGVLPLLIVVIDAELALRGRLPREPRRLLPEVSSASQSRPERLVQGRAVRHRRPVEERRTGLADHEVPVGIVLRDVVLGFRPSRRQEKPQLVFLDRTAIPGIEVVDRFERARLCLQAAAIQTLDWAAGGCTRDAGSGGVVGPLHGTVRAGHKHEAFEGVAAVARDVIDLHAAAGERRVRARRVDRHFLHRGKAGRRAERFAESNRRGGREAADRLPLFGRFAAMDREVGKRIPRCAADVLRAKRVRVGHADAAARPKDDPGCERREVDTKTTGRNGVDDFFGHDPLDVRALDVHDRRLARHGDRLGEGPDLQLRVHRGNEGAAELDAFAFERAEPGERKGHRVGARHQTHDLVLAGAVGDGDARLLDQGRTRRLHRHAGDDLPGRVLHGASNRRTSLGVQRPRNDRCAHECEQRESFECPHMSLSSCLASLA